ncbi:hypothetical protein RB195_014023 [Necator americanus]|uniref:Reverse transcriptase domain-containing protein n=1 Tax=Necator americanus TaxID=51031 RepID=A0ABR1DYB0_NECAM
MTICTYNASTFASAVEDLMMQAGMLKCDIIGLTETRRRHPLNTVYDWELFASLSGFWEDTIMDNIDDEYEWPVEYLRDCARKAKFQNHEETRDFGNSRADTIEEVLDEGQPCEQAGFRKGFSTIDQIHTISKLIEVSREYIMPLCLTFIGLKKAFDSVGAEALLHNPNFAIPREYRNLEWDDTGVKVDSRQLQHLPFADYTVQVTPSINQAEQMLTEFGETCGCFGLQLNLQKAMFMRKRWVSDAPLTLNGSTERTYPNPPAMFICVRN